MRDITIHFKQRIKRFEKASPRLIQKLINMVSFFGQKIFVIAYNSLYFDDVSS